MKTKHKLNYGIRVGFREGPSGPSKKDDLLQQKTADNVRSILNQRSKAQCPSAMLSVEIPSLQSEIARLKAHIAGLTAQQMAPSPRNLMRSTRL
uniref:Uncharacterized protein n=1 Tax=Romanomermis culicivorax TaxID=13658 RepID=A0A915IGG3_ROMCU